MAVADVDKTVAQVRSDGGKILVEPRDLPIARVAAVADRARRSTRTRAASAGHPRAGAATAGQFFWQEYLARDATQALGFYKRLAGYESTISESRLGVEYHVLRKTRRCAGLFQIPPTADVRPNWLPYVLVDDPAALSTRGAARGPYPRAGGTRAAGTVRSSSSRIPAALRSHSRSTRFEMDASMSRQNLFARVFFCLLILSRRFASSSCVNSMGVGIGVSSPTVWGAGGTSGPPIFVGGPSS